MQRSPLLRCLVTATRVLSAATLVFAFSATHGSAQQQDDDRQIAPPLQRDAPRRGANRQPRGESVQPLPAQFPDASIPAGLLPTDFAKDEFDAGVAVIPGRIRADDWPAFDFYWEASQLSHYPAYFEDVMLERHGQASHPLAQPFLSAARFCTDTAILPYNMGLDPHDRPISTLGHYRLGSEAPAVFQVPPLQLDAAVFQGAAAAGLIFLIP